MTNFFAEKLLTLTRNKVLLCDELPLARIKRIMKQDSCDSRPRMVSADAIPLMTYATQLFIELIAKLAWQHSTKPHMRNTLQAKDLVAAVNNSIMFDFLLDVIDSNLEPAVGAAQHYAPISLPIGVEEEKKRKNEEQDPHGPTRAARTSTP